MILDQFGKALPPVTRTRMRADSPATGAPYLPDGSWTYGFYDAINYSTNRSTKPFFAVDSRWTLNTWSRLRAMSLARWSYINIPVVRATVNLMQRLSVGTGFTPQTQAKDAILAKEVDQYILAKFESIGFRANESMDVLLEHDCRSVDIDGDFGYALTQNEFGEEKIQAVEAHRIKNGNITDPYCVDGIWVDDYARVAGYNVELPGDEGRTRRIDAKDFLFLVEPDRPDELRSMTALIHALAPLQDLYEIHGFAMQSVKKNSEWAAVIQTPTPNNPPALGPMIDVLMSNGQAATAGQPAVPQQTVTREQVYGSGGKIPILRPGETLAAYQPASTAANLKDWDEHIVRGIAAGYGVPFEVLWNPEKIGGANTRMILGILRARLLQRRRMLRQQKLRRIRFWLLCRAIKRGIFPLDPDIFRCTWRLNFTDITVDAGRESRERRANVLAGLDSFSNYFAENGSSYAEEVDVRKNEVALQCAAAEELASQFNGLTFAGALARIALLTQNAAEVGPSMTSSPDSQQDDPSQQNENAQ